jgi:hypothetical protein
MGQFESEIVREKLQIPLQKGEDKIKIVSDKIWRRRRY